MGALPLRTSARASSPPATALATLQRTASLTGAPASGRQACAELPRRRRLRRRRHLPAQGATGPTSTRNRR
eukprot:11174041-Lingulodinium_polyedra.AAC.1